MQLFKDYVRQIQTAKSYWGSSSLLAMCCLLWCAHSIFPLLPVHPTARNAAQQQDALGTSEPCPKLVSQLLLKLVRNEIWGFFLWQILIFWNIHSSDRSWSMNLWNTEPSPKCQGTKNEVLVLKYQSIMLVIPVICRRICSRALMLDQTFIVLW